MLPKDNETQKDDEIKKEEQEEIKKKADQELEAVEHEIKRKKDLERVDKATIVKMIKWLLFISFFPASALLLYEKLKNNGVEANWSNMKNALYSAGITEIVAGSYTYLIKKAIPKNLEPFSLRNLDQKDIEKIKKDTDKYFKDTYKELDKLEEQFKSFKGDSKKVLKEIERCRKELKDIEVNLEHDIEKHAQNFYEVGPARVIGRPASEEEAKKMGEIKPEHERLKQEFKKGKRIFSETLKAVGVILQNQLNPAQPLTYEKQTNEDRANEDRANEDRANEDRANEDRANEDRANEDRANGNRTNENRTNNDPTI